MTILLLAMLAVQSPRGAETFAAPAIAVTVRWDHNSTDATFKVHLRRSGSTYIGYLDAGTNKVFRFSGLQRKTTYKCYVTAVAGGLESLRSEELTFRTGNNANDPPEEL